MNVLVVCRGNICRSPFAEGLLRLVRSINCRSRATESFKVGKPADPTAVEVAAEFGVDLRDHRAAQVESQDIAWADVILLMDRDNLDRLIQRFPRSVLRSARLLGSYLSQDLEIPDPYKHGSEAFRTSFIAIRDACGAFARSLGQGSWIPDRT